METKRTIAILGSRDILEFEEFSRNFLEKLITHNTNVYGKNFSVISGGARGIDSLANEICKKFNVSIKIIRPNNPSIKQDYILRNFKIVDKSDKIYAIWDGKSAGTRSVIDYAKRKGKYIMIIQPC